MRSGGYHQLICYVATLDKELASLFTARVAFPPHFSDLRLSARTMMAPHRAHSRRWHDAPQGSVSVHSSDIEMLAAEPRERHAGCGELEQPVLRIPGWSSH